MISSGEVTSWLQKWQSFIREKNYNASRLLFRDDVYSFGTFSESISGLDDLVSYQWKVVWERSSNFTFDMDSVKLFPSGNNLIVVAVKWVGQGLDASSGRSFKRTGRASIVLEKDRESILCTHTHFSINPNQERMFRSNTNHES